MGTDKKNIIEQALSGNFATSTDAQSLAQYDVIVPLPTYEDHFFSDSNVKFGQEDGQYFYVGKFEDNNSSLLDRDIDGSVVFLPVHEHYEADNVNMVARSKLTDSAINKIQELAIISNQDLVIELPEEFRPTYGDPDQHFQNMRSFLSKQQYDPDNLEGYLDIPDAESVLKEMLTQLSDAPASDNTTKAIDTIQNVLILPRIRENLLETIQTSEISDKSVHADLVCEFDNVNNLQKPVYTLQRVQERSKPQNLEI